ncbi:hypothetical protein DRQ33_02700 [bacterium]|nr:MAG: hypothetical protein DRQ33_02700 [bacterium]
MENVLITGATGFIGSHTAELLVEQGYKVRAIIRNESRIEKLPHNVEPIICSLFNPYQILDIIEDTHYFVHIAGLTKALHKRDFYRVNAESTRIWLEILSRYSAKLRRFILLSSQAAVRPSSEPIDETAEPAPLTDYGKSKLQAEQYARRYMEKIPITIIRAPAVYGPRDRDIYFYFKLASMGIVPLVGNPNRKFSAIYVEDLARAILLTMNNDVSNGEIFFVTDGEIYTWRQFGEEIGKVIGGRNLKIWLPGITLWIAACVDEMKSFILRKPALLSFQKVRELLAPWVADSSKFFDKLDFVPNYDMKSAVRKTAEWYRKNGWI